MTNILSPGKVILFGEHAVVHDKLGVSTAIGKYTKVKIRPRKDGCIRIKSVNFGLDEKKTINDVLKLNKKVESLRKKNEIDKIRNLAENDKLIPSFVVVGKIMEKYGFKPCSIEIESDVPKNLGSSASVFNGIVMGLSEFMGLNLSKKEVGFFANEGDKIVHGNPSGIDAYTISHGGWIMYRKSEGIKPLEIQFKLPLLIVDSGESARTSETVRHVKKQKEKNPERVNSILHKIDKISREGVKAIKSGDIKTIGNLMTEHYQELKKLGISTPKLDEIVNTAIENGAYAKPTGGWGGGCCIVLPNNNESELIKKYSDLGYNAFKTELGVGGVKQDLSEN